ncbi:methyl-accepting chemotaxis protein [Methyloradius palustris]|uniref:Chemotaxis protein n=1 Tax=Methyloradius palustris TaxID=2778876 RepID=A0A8D5G578_9PROT|nr:methyl-accepting chemotaxis protein [Methyloradius palustris]BCM25935.1 chemotaxis protein [Methyloradius palustris]
MFGGLNKVFGSAKSTKISNEELANLRGQVSAISKSQGVIEFTMEGNVITANDTFLNILGYSLSEVKGQPHSQFIEPSYRSSNEYQQFWQKLNHGEFDTGVYKRIGKDDREVWIQASYNPIFDLHGKPFKIVKYATDVTAGRIKNSDYESQIAAIGKSQGVIEFTMEGHVIQANDTFLNLLGYSSEETKGEHHSKFVDPIYRSTAEYKQFWEKLNRGEYDAGIYKRIGKGGREVWIQASYNPIFDLNGKPFKVVKYSTDVTAERIKNADYEGQIAAIGKSQGVIEFTMDGNVICANDTFLNVLGYTAEEAQGQHHSKFVEPTYCTSTEYKQFWEKLNRGEYDAGIYKRIGKGGHEVWIQASYNPIFDLNGKPYKVVKYATDVTKERLRNADFEGQIAAISKSQGVIEFSMDGKVLTSNDAFLNILGYSLAEAQGQHHSTFVEPAHRTTTEYKQFWEKLNRGEYDAGVYKRVGKSGCEVWIQASYNPIFDLNGKPFKVVKYATDVTAQINASKALADAVAESQIVVSAAKSNDLTKRIPLNGKTGEIAGLCEGINSLIENMSEVITQIKEASGTITGAASDISTGNNDLSQRTEEQASSLEETAASMEELASTVKRNSDNAKQANRLAAEASDVANKGGKVVSDVVTTMSDISASSRKIEDIISVIDGIAFQTNILALNAAVEAARAGEQGRGFAVVAAEVRNLAQRSAAAAKEIKDLISDSVAKVTSGTQLVEEAGITMGEIVTSVERVTAIMGDIAAASSEQSTGIDQVNTAVTQMDQVTQQNAALVEQAAAAAESLLEQAEVLTAKVNLFRLNNDAPLSTDTRKSSIRVIPAHSVQRSIPKLINGDDDWEQF